MESQQELPANERTHVLMITCIFSQIGTHSSAGAGTSRDVGLAPVVQIKCDLVYNRAILLIRRQQHWRYPKSTTTSHCT